MTLRRVAVVDVVGVVGVVMKIKMPTQILIINT